MVMYLKERCHRDFSSYWFSSAKITAFYLLSFPKSSYRISKMNSNEILGGRASHDNFFGDFFNVQLEILEQLANFFKFQSISIHAILDGIYKFLV